MSGTVGVLSVGAGDTKLSFDPSNPAERIRAARIVRDMLRRGYALLVEVERDGVKRFERAIDFDESVCEYVIADFDPMAAQRADKEQPHGNDEQNPAPRSDAPAEAPRRGRGRPAKVSVPAESTRAFAVARISGG